MSLIFPEKGLFEQLMKLARLEIGLRYWINEKELHSCATSAQQF